MRPNGSHAFFLALHFLLCFVHDACAVHLPSPCLTVLAVSPLLYPPAFHSLPS